MAKPSGWPNSSSRWPYLASQNRLANRGLHAFSSLPSRFILSLSQDRAIPPSPRSHVVAAPPPSSFATGATSIHCRGHRRPCRGHHRPCRRPPKPLSPSIAASHLIRRRRLVGVGGARTLSRHLPPPASPRRLRPAPSQQVAALPRIMCG